MSQPMKAHEFLEKAIVLSGKSQREIAHEIGYTKANVLSMMKQGITKIPVEKVPALAKACGVDQKLFVHIVMSEYQPETWRVLREAFGDLLTPDEHNVLQAYRSQRDSAQGTVAETPEMARQMAVAFASAGHC